ncbi:hypothetical protein MRX96_031895 [Rhipicephalus microplus]
MEARRGWNDTTTSFTGSRRFVAGRARQRAVRKAVALLAFLAACCVLSRIRTINTSATPTRLLCTRVSACHCSFYWRSSIQQLLRPLAAPSQLRRRDHRLLSPCTRAATVREYKYTSEVPITLKFEEPGRLPTADNRVS